MRAPADPARDDFQAIIGNIRPVRRVKQTGIEWTLLGVIAVVCAVLAFLQYRWTGELSRAEPALLRAGLNEQVRRFAQTFNEDIRDSCTMLLPDAADIRAQGLEAAHHTRYEQWATVHDRALFKKIGVAVPEQGVVHLYAIDAPGHIAPMDWPVNWEPFRVGMTARVRGGGRPP